MTEEFLVRINVQELMFQQIHEKLGRNDVMNVVTVLKKKGGEKKQSLILIMTNFGGIIHAQIIINFIEMLTECVQREINPMLKFSS